MSPGARAALAVGLAVAAAESMPTAAGAAETPGDAGFIVAGSRNSAGFGIVRTFADNDNNGTYETLVSEFVPYSSTVTNGVRVAAGDFDGDGNDELVTASDENASVKIYELTPSGAPGALADSQPGFTQGTHVAAGDLNGDGLDELIMGADPGGTPRVTIRSDLNADGTLETLTNGFDAYPSANDGGVRVAAGDTDNDGDDEVITGPGPDPGLAVKIWDDTDHDRAVGDNPRDDSFVPYGASWGGGVFVAAGPIDNAGSSSAAEVIVSAGAGQSRNVLIRTDADFPPDGRVSDDPPFDQLPPPYGASFTSGVRVAAGDTDHSGSLVEVITAPGADAGTRNVKVYDDDGDSGVLLSDNGLDDFFVPFPGNGSPGAFVAFAQTTSATYTDTDTPLPIPDNGTPGDPLEAEIRVPRSAGIVRDLDVYLGISHTFDSDLDVGLTHSGGSGSLFTKVGHNDDGIFVWLDDGAPTNIASVPDDPNDHAVTGTYTTEPSILEFFNGQDASGRWILTVDDTSGSDVGTLQQWSLRIRY